MKKIDFKKKFEKKTRIISNQKKFNGKSKILVLKLLIFIENFLILENVKIFERHFFSSQKIFFLGVEKKSGQSSETENRDLLIAHGFRAIRATRREGAMVTCRNARSWRLSRFIQSGLHVQKIHGAGGPEGAFSIKKGTFLYLELWGILCGSASAPKDSLGL